MAALPGKSDAARRPWAFSIQTLLAVVALVCVSTSHIFTSRELRSTRQELARLRDQVGELSIEDDQAVQVVSVPTPEKHMWRWRLHVPNSAQLVWVIAHDLLPPTGLPRLDSGTFYRFDPAVPGEYLVIAKLYKNGEGIFVAANTACRQGGLRPSPRWPFQVCPVCYNESVIKSCFLRLGSGDRQASRWPSAKRHFPTLECN